MSDEFGAGKGEEGLSRRQMLKVLSAAVGLGLGARVWGNRDRIVETVEFGRRSFGGDGELRLRPWEKILREDAIDRLYGMLGSDSKALMNKEVFGKSLEKIARPISLWYSPGGESGDVKASLPKSASPGGWRSFF